MGVGDLAWVAEPQPARWDEDKARIVGDEAEGVFRPQYGRFAVGEIIPGTWFRVERDGEVVGYGWMDLSWGNAEILVATRKDVRGRGVGSFVLDRLRDEAESAGMKYVTNVVRNSHPEKDRVTQWLEKRGFAAGEDGRMFRALSRPSVPPPAG